MIIILVPIDVLYTSIIRVCDTVYFQRGISIICNRIFYLSNACGVSTYGALLE